MQDMHEECAKKQLKQRDEANKVEVKIKLPL
jgi:hypothetical protein